MRPNDPPDDRASAASPIRSGGEEFPDPTRDRPAHFPQGCLSFDLEVGGRGSIRALAGVAIDGNVSIHAAKAGEVEAGLSKLDRLARQCRYVLGHNIVAHDLPWLRAARPDSALLSLPAIDTLRLNPLAFPRNPYHRLVKHYKDGALLRAQLSDPELDSRLAAGLFAAQIGEFGKADPDLMAAWHWLITPDPDGADRALDELFSDLRGGNRPPAVDARAAMDRRLDAGGACRTHRVALLETAERRRWGWAYALAWLSVCGGNSVLPPWVRHNCPDAVAILRGLRDEACADAECNWCRTRLDAKGELKRWFGFDDFRPHPADAEGRSLQQAIVEATLGGGSSLGILPTGTGKSLCYQIPALSKYDRTGALTVVISPLVALMADQIATLERKNISSAVSVNGLLSMPERADALDRIRLGDASIVLIAPEQLRSRTLVDCLAQREIGLWVLDEAHCLSKWGHDFRPDYQYFGRFVRETMTGDAPPPILCLTATAKPSVVEDILGHFRDHLDLALAKFDGGAERTNLQFEVQPTDAAGKPGQILELLEERRSGEDSGGAIVYCATRQHAEDVAAFLSESGIEAAHFHSRVSPEAKKDVQARFIAGELRAIAATNAFGMGIDKPDVRLVIHADIPSSLESYLQEAGRAGRDLAPARCVLLYDRKDVEWQFSLSARGRLSRAEIGEILRKLRTFHKRFNRGKARGEIVATPGEITADREDGEFRRDSATDDMRVRTAVAWLEHAKLLVRNENVVNVFPSSLRITTLDQARNRLEKKQIASARMSQLFAIAKALVNADPTEGISTDDLMLLTGLDSHGVRRAMHELEACGVVSNDTAITAFVHKGTANPSGIRLDAAETLERALIGQMEEMDPDLGIGQKSILDMRIAAQILRDEGIADPLPERLNRIIRSVSRDGADQDEMSTGSLSVRKIDATRLEIILRRDWNALAKTAEIRRDGARHLLAHLLDRLPKGRSGADLLAETTIGKLNGALAADMEISSRVRHIDKLVDRALLWLHELEIVKLNKGLAVFRPALTIVLDGESPARGFADADFKPLAIHYDTQRVHTHIMKEYAERALVSLGDAQRLVADYFALGEAEFLGKWLQGREEEIGRETTPESWTEIVESLGNPVQQQIVAHEGKRNGNVLVLAGPGSGKTRVLVHRIAHLVRIRRQDPAGILALTYNRHAAVEIRKRLDRLIGAESRAVRVMTCHAFAMQVVGRSFSGVQETSGATEADPFRAVLREAVCVLTGQGLEPEDADEQRLRLLEGFRWILVDEYQDIDGDQYELISAVAGRTLERENAKLSLLAVGDDDQNIYGFAGASVEFIRRFEADFAARPTYLVENFRSTAHIIQASNAVIAPAANRMKADRPIRIDRARKGDAPGGAWAARDPVARGRVQILPAGKGAGEQAVAVMSELMRLSRCGDGWRWEGCAVLAREWRDLELVRRWCEINGIPVQMGNEYIPRFWRVREARALVDAVTCEAASLVNRARLLDGLGALPDNRWTDLLRQAIEEFHEESHGRDVPQRQFVEWLAEWSREIRRRPTGLTLTTCHGAKGLEFDHVAILDGAWDRYAQLEDTRRLYYVAMTRARETLILARQDGGNRLLEPLDGLPSALWRDVVPLPPAPAGMECRHAAAKLCEVDLGYAGRRRDGDAVHARIACLSTGDPLRIVERNKGFKVLDRDGDTVGRLAKGFRPRSGHRLESASVHAILQWRPSSRDPELNKWLKTERWEVVIPEFVYVPEKG